MTHAHPDDCLCGPCLDDDFAQHVSRTFGDDMLARVMSDGTEQRQVKGQRTRYAKPGQVVGHGKTVRKVSAKQVKFMRSLFATRDTSGLTRLPGSEDIENMSLRGARDLIERLLNCPELDDAREAEPMATDKQVAFARSLASQKGIEAEDYASMTRREVSAEIEAMKAMPNAPREATPEIEQGMYLYKGHVYKVQRAVHGSGNLYAKHLVRDDDGTAHFEYSPGAVRKLKAEWKMTLEQAKEYGALYGVCCACSRTLTDEQSIADGIGPVCARKHFG